MNGSARIRVTCLAMALAACASTPGALEPSGEELAALTGEPSTAADDAVVRTNVYYGVSCTGTLLAPNVLATALHCVAQYGMLGTFECNDDGTQPESDSSAGRIGALLPADDIDVFWGANPEASPSAVGKEIFSTGSTTLCSDDLALLVLDRELPVRGFPIRVDRPVVAGEQVTLVGYDQQEDSPQPSRSRRSHVPVLAVGPDVYTEEATNLLPRIFLVEEGPCWSDAGGPALAEETGAVVGIYSRPPSGNCVGEGSYNIYTKLAPFRELVLRALQSAGHVPNLEKETDEPAAATASRGCAVAPGAGAGAGAPALVLVALFVGPLALLSRRRRRAPVVSEFER